MGKGDPFLSAASTSNHVDASPPPSETLCSCMARLVLPTHQIHVPAHRVHLAFHRLIHSRTMNYAVFTWQFHRVSAGDGAWSPSFHPFHNRSQPVGIDGPRRPRRTAWAEGARFEVGFLDGNAGTIGKTCPFGVGSSFLWEREKLTQSTGLHGQRTVDGSEPTPTVEVERCRHRWRERRAPVHDGRRDDHATVSSAVPVDEPVCKVPRFRTRGVLGVRWDRTVPIVVQDPSLSLLLHQGRCQDAPCGSSRRPAGPSADGSGRKASLSVLSRAVHLSKPVASAQRSRGRHHPRSTLGRRPSLVGTNPMNPTV